MASDGRGIFVVTGASRGIGRAIAIRLLEQGGVVHGAYNTGEREVEEISDRYPGFVSHQADLSVPDDTERLLSELRGLRIRGLVNNAGMFATENFEDFDFQLWRDTFEVNLNVPLRLALGLLGQYTGDAAIVNIASLDGLVGSFVSMSYSATKAALINLTKSLGNNFGQRGLRVNTILPGWIDTGMSTPESYEAVDITPLGRNGTPEEVAALTSFLLGPESSFINGEAIAVDGGFKNVNYIHLLESRRVRGEARAE